MPGRRSGDFRLGAASRARRRLLMTHAVDELDFADDAFETPAEDNPHDEPLAAVVEAAAAPPAVPLPKIAEAPAPPRPALAVSPPRVPRPLADAPGVRRVRRMLTGSAPVTWVFTGDELTQGGAQSAKRRTFSEIFGERVRLELCRYLDVVINTGIAGDRAAALARNLERRVLRFRPDVVSITLGLNDATRGPAGRAEFGEKLAQILAELKAEGAVPLLHVPNRFPLDGSPAHADLPAYVELLRAAAKEAEVPLLDHWSDWRSHRQSRSWLAGDRIRPNAYGHRAMARLLFAALDIYDERSPCCE
ncbi:MAG: GDSL-type esterase/lipase family protein [Planctomycetales bacterium]